MNKTRESLLITTQKERRSYIDYEGTLSRSECSRHSYLLSRGDKHNHRS